MANLSLMWSVTIIVIDQRGALMQYYKYELVLTVTDCSTFYEANVTGWRKTLKYDSKFHSVDAIIYVYVYIYIYIHIHTYIYIYIHTFEINLQAAAVSLFESSSKQLRSNEDLEGPGCSNYYIVYIVYIYYIYAIYILYICIYIYMYIYIIGMIYIISLCIWNT